MLLFGQILGIGYNISLFFLQNQWNFLNSKKGNWVYLGQVKYIGVKAVASQFIVIVWYFMLIYAVSETIEC